MRLGNMVLGFLIAALVVVIGLLAPGIENVLAVLARVGMITVFFWALLTLIRGPQVP